MATELGYKAKEPAESTNAQPGTRDKVELMAERMASGEELWHVGDRTCFEGGEE